MPSIYHKLPVPPADSGPLWGPVLEGLVSVSCSPLSFHHALHPCAEGEPLPRSGPSPSSRLLLLAPPLRLDVGQLFSSWSSSDAGRFCPSWALELALSQGSCTTLHGGQPLPCSTRGLGGKEFPASLQWWQTSAYISAGSWAEQASCPFPSLHALSPFPRLLFLLDVSPVVGRDGVRG